MMVVRFSAMGELQAVLESETMVGKFTQACEGVASTLQSLLAENMKVRTPVNKILAATSRLSLHMDDGHCELSACLG